MSDYAELVGRLEKQSVCIHIAAEPECAKDVSDGLRKAADAINALVQERDALLAENSKLRSALEIVHFKREPWQ